MKHIGITPLVIIQAIKCLIGGCLQMAKWDWENVIIRKDKLSSAFTASLCS